MLKNKTKLKKMLLSVCIATICLLVLFLIINICEYNTYKKNYNLKIAELVYNIKVKYPEVSEKEIIEVLNENNNSASNEVFEKYFIDLEKDSVILQNDQQLRKFTIFNVLSVLGMAIVLLCIFLIYNHDKDKEIKKIAKYIEQINKKDYTLYIDENSEDELSILKNEVYKTTLMLKEHADNSLKDKKDLKQSLEDISHQLKTPLTSMLIMLDNLIDEPEMNINTRQDFINEIKRDALNISFLVQSILTLSKIDSNTINFHKNETLLENIVNNAIQNVAPLCDLKNVQINVEGTTNTCINCDFKWQVEAISNIIKNCVEHSKPNAKIDINCQINKAYGLITIQDYAGGISPKDLPHIFERFYKGQNSTRDSVGIGLALAKSIIEKDKRNNQRQQ